MLISVYYLLYNYCFLELLAIFFKKSIFLQQYLINTCNKY